VDHSDVGRLAEWLPTVIFEPPLTGYVVALGIGLLLGIERERRKGEGPSRAPAGIRTFAISALLGAIAIHTGGEIAFSVAIAGVVGLTALAYYRSPSEDPGLTSEIALVVAVALGGLAMREQALAAALAVTVAILLTARVPMHRFVREVLTQSELRSILIFAAATLIVWPVIPDRYVGPFAAINPRALWQVVILILAISAVGHTAVRGLGARFGLPLAGLASGFISSAATIAAMGARAADDPKLMRPAVAGAALSTVATVVQLAVLLAATSPTVLSALTLPLLYAGLAAAAYGALIALRTAASTPDATTSYGDALSLRAALILAATFGVILLAAAAMRVWFGDKGILVAAAITGLADAHATAVSAASLAASGMISAQTACLPVLIGLTTNTLTKSVLAFTSGNRPFAWRILPGLLLVLAGAWLGYYHSL
jgi:uncharacterized membrane protein (DUF4010 family)